MRQQLSSVGSTLIQTAFDDVFEDRSDVTLPFGVGAWGDEHA